MTTALQALVRSRFANTPAQPPRLGLELELLPFRVTGEGAPVPPHDTPEGPGTLFALRVLAKASGWQEAIAYGGLPRFQLPDGGVLSYEPGGQLEWASPPHRSLTRLDASARALAEQLSEACAAHDISLLARGLDPRTPADRAVLVTDAPRYRRQQAHYDRRGPDGRTMMLQTAGIHVNVDPGPDTVTAWEVCNALSPVLTAICANSRVRPGVHAPHRSHRAGIWRGLDPTRTGAFAPSTNAADAYTEFALNAESFLLGDEGAPSRSFREWVDAGVSYSDCERHLTTLFPEVRPRSGYLEVRACDALPARWAIVPGAIVWAALHHKPWRDRLRHTLPMPNSVRLMSAAEAGTRDETLGAEAQWVLSGTVEALEAARAIHPENELDTVSRRVQEFGEVFTMRGQDPGDAEHSLLTD